MARLYVDHNVSRDVGPPLWAFGHDLLFTRDPSSARLTDDAHLLASVRARRVLVTHDRHDFRMLHNAWVTWPAAFSLDLPAHAGILILDQARPDYLARVLAHFLQRLPADQFANAIFWWHHHDGWRQPASGTTWEPLPADFNAERE